MQYLKHIVVLFLLTGQLIAMQTPTLTVTDIKRKKAVLKKKRIRFEKKQEAIQKPLIILPLESFPQLSENVSAEATQFFFNMSIPMDNLEIAAKTINQLPLLCKAMNTFINDEENTRAIIKKLSHVFECADEISAQTLQTKEATKIFLLQDNFKSTITHSTAISPLRSSIFRKNNIDLDFSYGFFGNTALRRVVTTNDKKNKLSILKWLLDNGADLNGRPDGTLPIIFSLVTDYTRGSSEACQYFFECPRFNINDCPEGTPGMKESKITLLHYLLVKSPDLLAGRNNNDSSDQLDRLNLLLKYNANPVLKGPGKINCLDMARTVKHETLITLFEDAIKKIKASQPHKKRPKDSKQLISSKQHSKKHSSSKKKSTSIADQATENT